MRKFECPGWQKMTIRVVAIIVVTAVMVAITDGIGALLSVFMAALLTGPFAFLWWPEFRNSIGLQPLLGIIPLSLIIAGIFFRANNFWRKSAYIGALLWPIIGCLYVITHIK